MRSLLRETEHLREQEVKESVIESLLTDKQKQNKKKDTPKSTDSPAPFSGQEQVNESKEPSVSEVGNDALTNDNDVVIFRKTHIDLDPVAGLENDFIERALLLLPRDILNKARADILVTDSPQQKKEKEDAAELVDAIRNLFRDVDIFAKELNKQLQEDLAKIKFKDQAEVKNIEFFKEFVNFQKGRVLALVTEESIKNGKPEYEPILLRNAILATLDFALNEGFSGDTNDRKEIIKQLGLQEDTNITPQMKEIVNFGRAGYNIKENLARHILTFWQAELNYAESETLVRGPSEALAHEIINYFTRKSAKREEKATRDNTQFDVFWIHKKAFKFRPPGSEHPFNLKRFRMVYPGKPLGGYRTIIRDLFLDKDNEIFTRQIGHNFFQHIPETQKRNQEIKLTGDQQTALKNMTGAAFNVSSSLVRLFGFFGHDVIGYILGYEKLKNKDGRDVRLMNVNHRASVEGRNNSIVSATTHTQYFIDAVEAFAALHGLDPVEVGIYYSWFIGPNSRFHMNDGRGPQGEKLAREMFNVNSDTLDLDNQQHLDYFHAAVAQALGVKIDKIGIEQSIIEAKSLIGNPEESTPYRGVIETLKDVLKLIDSKEADSLTDDQRRPYAIRLYQGVIGNGLERTPKMLKALAAIAHYEIALEKGETFLKTDLSLELDGKAHGPATAAVQMTTGGFTSQQINLFNTAGYFIGPGIAIHESGEIIPDLYETVADVFSRFAREFNKQLKQGIHTAGGNTNKRGTELLVNAQMAILDLFNELGDVDFSRSRKDDTKLDANGDPVIISGELVISRGNVKNPITQQLYGAGNKSIANGYADQIFSAIYEEITNALQNFGKEGANATLERYADLIDFLINTRIFRNNNKKRLGLEAFVKDSNEVRKNPLQDLLNSKDRSKWINFSFKNQEFINVSRAIQFLYVDNLTDSLSLVIGSSVKENNQILVDASQNLTRIYNRIYELYYDREKDHQRNTGIIGEGHELSRESNNKIKKSLAWLRVIYAGENGAFTTSTPTIETNKNVEAERAEQKKEGKPQRSTKNRISEAVDGEQLSTSYVIPGEPGVKVLPFNVIGNGDAYLMTLINQYAEIARHALSVHDGIEAALTYLDEFSRIMNETLYKTWQTNTIEPIYKRTKTIFERLKEGNADQQSVRDLLTDKEWESLQESVYELERISRERDARIYALDKMFAHIQGIVGVGVGYEANAEKGVLPQTEEEALKLLNRYRNEYLANHPLSKPANDFFRNETYQARIPEFFQSKKLDKDGLDNDGSHFGLKEELIKNSTTDEMIHTPVNS